MKVPISTESSKANKTGTWRIAYPIVDKQKCIGCKICQNVCPDSCAKVIKKKANIDLDYCKGCGICCMECPVKAITMKKEER